MSQLFESPTNSHGLQWSYLPTQMGPEDVAVRVHRFDDNIHLHLPFDALILYHDRKNVNRRFMVVSQSASQQGLTLAMKPTIPIEKLF